MYEKMFGVHGEQSILLLLEDLHNVVTVVIAELGRISNKGRGGMDLASLIKPGSSAMNNPTS